MIQESDFCLDWKFFKGDALDAYRPDFDDSAWRTVSLPHDWSIEGPKDRRNPGGRQNGYFPGGIGWYRKRFRLSPEAADKKVLVQFDEVYHNSEVWINGRSLGRRPYGYIHFEHDLTDYLRIGQDNVLSVRVDNSDQPNCRWYSGSGIYRRVRLLITDKLCVVSWGTAVTTPQIDEKRASIKVCTEVQNAYPQPQECILLTQVIDPKGKTAAETRSVRLLRAGEHSRFEEQIEISRPELWSPDQPNLYTVRSLVRTPERLCDIYETPFGIRRIALDSNRGFLLNGVPVKMKGVCIHHDAGSLGAAVPVRVWERRLEILQSIGCNAIRTSHNPPAPELPDLCDRMGFLVIEEAFDKWDGRYGRWFESWWKQDLVDMIQRDRNHPSVVIWSVGNEVSGQGGERFMEQLSRLVDETRRHDPTRPVTCALRPFDIRSREENAQIIAQIAKAMDVVSCNYQEQWFEDYRKEYPEILIIASESYPFYRGKEMSYKAFEPLNPWLEAEKHDYVLGTFYWTGIDYLGEAEAGWPYHGWNCSLIDTCGFVRPVGHLVRSFWSKEPMVYLAVLDDSLEEPNPTKDHWGWPKMASHWTVPVPEGQLVKIAVFSNCPTAEVFLNGQSMGRKERCHFPDGMMIWKIPYIPGRIEARGLKEEKTLCTYQLRTAGRPTQICLLADRNVLRADGQDVSHVEVQIQDAEGVVVPNAAHTIRYFLDGPGTILGVDNGDLTSMESYQASERKVFQGRALVIIQSARQEGAITLRARADGLKEAAVVIQTAACESINKDLSAAQSSR